MSENIGWSEAEDRKLARMWLVEDPPRTTREIADELEKSKSAVYRRIKALDLRGKKGERPEYEKLYGVKLDPVIKPARVENAHNPTGEPLGTEYTMLVWGDVHYPHEDPEAVDVLYQITRDLKPEVLVCLGDVFDFFEISDYRMAKDDEPDLQKAINQGVQHLDKMLELSGAYRAHFLGGNHEDRWDRMLDKARRDIRFRQLLKLPKVRRSLDFEEVVGFQDLGYEYEPYVEGETLVFHDKLVVAHGHRTNKYATRGMLDDYGKSVIFGHTHRIQNFTYRDLKGQESGWSIGCLCELDMHYTHSINTAHGFAVVTWNCLDGKWFYNVEQVRIHDGRAIYRDKTYIAEVD